MNIRLHRRELHPSLLASNSTVYTHKEKQLKPSLMFGQKNCKLCRSAAEYSCRRRQRLQRKQIDVDLCEYKSFNKQERWLRIVVRNILTSHETQQVNLDRFLLIRSELLGIDDSFCDLITQVPGTSQ